LINSAIEETLISLDIATINASKNNVNPVFCLVHGTSTSFTSSPSHFVLITGCRWGDMPSIYGSQAT
jgi:hypothetical protein